jgi:hypothetical protein
MRSVSNVGGIVARLTRTRSSQALGTPSSRSNHSGITDSSSSR